MDNKKDKKQDKNSNTEAETKNKNKWQIACIGTSVLSGFLLILVLILISQPPKVQQEYLPCPASSSSDSKSYSSNSSSSNSPSSSSSSSSNSSASKNSETITYTSGEKVGTSAKGVTIEIEQVIKNYQNYSSYYKPESGYEYVQVKIKFKNNTGNAISLYSFDFYLEDSDGMMDDAELSSSDNNTSYFPFSKQLASGAEASGVMLFEVKKGATDSITFLYEKDTPTKRVMIKL